MKTTKPFRLTLLLILISVNIYAQFYISPSIKAGMNNSTLQFESDDYLDVSSKNEIAVGLGIEFKVVGPFSIQTEASYTKIGADIIYSDPAMYAPIEFSVSADYIEVPLLAKVAFDLVSPLSVNLYAGPALAFKVDESSEFDINFTPEEDAIKNTTRLLQIGGGLVMAAGPASILLDLRYSIGLNNIAEEEEFLTIDGNRELTTNSLLLSLGVGF